MYIFRKLRWKLTLSYTLVTVGVLLSITLVLGGIFMIRVFTLSTNFPPGRSPTVYIAGFMNPENATSSYSYYCMVLSQTPQDLNLVNRMLKKLQAISGEEMLFTFGQLRFLAQTTAFIRVAIFKPDGTLLGSSESSDPAFRNQIGKPYNPAQVPGLEVPFRAAITGSKDPNLLFTEVEKDRRYVFTAPCFNRSGDDPNLVTGIIALLIDAYPSPTDAPRNLLNVVWRSSGIFLLVSGILGAILGYSFAHGLATRFKDISTITDSWSQGDFSSYINDTIGDEVSQFTQRLNKMAKQLESLMHSRQEMAISEERNRLARDLHDSAKQQALAASFEIGTALTLYDRDPQSAREHLIAAESLVDSVRKELTSLVDELRPLAGEAQDFGIFLREYAVEWSQRSGIELKTCLEGELDIIEENRQTLFRIMQEALANITRHSRAKSAEITVNTSLNIITMVIKDDGCGFETSAKHIGMGLSSMRERAEEIGGSFEVESQPGQGTQVKVTLPGAG